MKEKIIIAICALVIILLLHFLCITKAENMQLLDDSTAIKSLNEQLNFELEKTINEKHELIVKTDALVLENQKSMNLLKQSKQLKNLQTQVQIKTVTLHDTISTVLKDTVILIKGLDTIQSFNFNDSWLSFNGLVQKKEVKILDLKLKNDFSIEIGEEKKHWYSKKIKTAYIKSKNPHTDITEFKPIILNDTKKWYEKGGAYFVSGAITTLILVLAL